MTDPLSIGIAAAASAVALVAGWLQWPRPPDLDGERWFKVTLATLLRGEVEASGGSAADWEAAVLRFVPYHPAGRLPERKVSNPVAARLPGAHLPGERALLDVLARRDSLAERWAWMYDEDPVAVDARLDDPAELGPAYDPDALVGAGWDALAAWGAGDPAFLQALRRRYRARWVLVEGRSEPVLIGALQDVLSEEATRIQWAGGELGEAEADLLAERLRALLPSRDARLMLVAEEAGVAWVLRALAAAADLRDQVDAVLSVGGIIGGLPGVPGPLGERDAEDWLGAHFNQAGLDTEVVRLTPYLSVQWLDRQAPVIGVGELPIAAQRFPVPPDDAVETIEAVDLGVLPVDPELPSAQVARALVATVACWVLSRR